ncbi:glycoside hydrolase family 76 protein [Verrucomicrobiota bacterium sgz303538]
MPTALRLLLLVFLVTGGSYAASPDRPSYEARAREVMDHIEKTLWNETTGLYVKSTSDSSPEDMWGNGVMFSALVGAARHDPEKYVPIMQKFIAAMDGYWDAKATVPGYEPLPIKGAGPGDKYYDDNAWMVITFLEAYELTHDARFLTKADQTLEFVLSGWDDEGGGGIWWHEGHKDGSKNTCANAPAAVSCLRLAKFKKEAAAELTAKAQRIVDWTVATFQAEDGLFWDSKKIASGEINRGKLTYNSALMLRAFRGLHSRTGKSEFLAAAQRIGKAADAFIGRGWPVYRNPVKWSHLMAEADLELYRTTKEDYLLTRAKQDAEFRYSTWTTNPPADLISNASIARELWLMADTETEVGRKFWEAADKSGE